ncbi:hypothetical protein [Desertibacillus haloalkaliphilus]|uniref:hypothetical protein n=1 Tax=Desertibacillus haloalkaliphilus TaxID=1328930 RepID=UPI001C267173|nr:hypothetical protein [Desertibacillus haloalkaliphilus]MBU8908010.1 hypothetical protein [Desertibacillus haloalkaliphilus]
MATNKQNPDFKQLTDRVIRERPKQPIFAMKTNLDQPSPLTDNPYVRKSTVDHQEEKKIESFFEER